MSDFFSGGNKKIILVSALIILALAAVVVKLKLADNPGLSNSQNNAAEQETKADPPGATNNSEIVRTLPGGLDYVRTEKPESDGSYSNRPPEKRFYERDSFGKITAGKGKLAIIIDDLGQSTAVFDKLIELDFDITYSILPRLPRSEQTAETVFRYGRETMLHLPMEPKEALDNDPGEGALFISDSAEIIRRKIETNLRSVPYAAGVNNHMGSLFTLNAPGLAILMEFLSENYLFFIDSKTAPGNLAKNTAREYGALYFSRDIFLDNIQDESYVAEQLFKAAKIALRRGKSIAIGHPYEVTYYVLSEYLSVVEQNGVEIVKVSQLF